MIAYDSVNSKWTVPLTSDEVRFQNDIEYEYWVKYIFRSSVFRFIKMTKFGAGVPERAGLFHFIERLGEHNYVFSINYSTGQIIFERNPNTILWIHSLTNSSETV